MRQVMPLELSPCITDGGVLCGRCGSVGIDGRSADIAAVVACTLFGCITFISRVTFVGEAVNVGVVFEVGDG